MKHNKYTWETGDVTITLPRYTDAYVAGGQTRRKPARKQKPRPEAAAVARYEQRLADDYRDWADDLAAQLADDPDNADELIAAASGRGFCLRAGLRRVWPPAT